MKTAFLTIFFVVLGVVNAQPATLTVNGRPVGADNTATIEAGKPAVIAVNVAIKKNTKLSWTKDGEGEFTTEPVDQPSVQFRPRAPGDVVVVVCELTTPNGQERPTVTLRVAGETTPPVQSTKAVPPPKPVAVKGTPSTVEHPHATTPAGELYLSDMENVVFSGWQGDAVADNGEAASLDAGNTDGCYKPQSSCVRIDYKPTNGKVGWAAFAAQRVTEGSSNWGESPGLDLSSGHYLSLRVRAKGQPGENGAYPKVKFQTGGNVAPKYASTNRATYTVSSPTVDLKPRKAEEAWTDVCVSLKDKDLSNVVSPFTAIVTKAGFPKGAVIFLDEVRFSTQACPEEQKK